MSQYYNDNSQLDNQIEQDKQKHQRTKLTLKICGIVAIVVGLACAVASMVDFFKAFNSEGEYMPKLFFLCFIGLPLVGVGAACLAFALRGNIARYVQCHDHAKDYKDRNIFRTIKARNTHDLCKKRCNHAKHQTIHKNIMQIIKNSFAANTMHLNPYIAYLF